MYANKVSDINPHITIYILLNKCYYEISVGQLTLSCEVVQSTFPLISSIVTHDLVYLCYNYYF